MAPINAEQLAQRLSELKLVDRQQLRALEERHDPRTMSGTEFLQILLRRELLTNYQADRLMRGDKQGYFYGKYKVLYPISQGSFARVYRAVDDATGKSVALKVLRKRYASESEIRERFRREGELGRTLKHPNIVDIKDHFPEGNDYFILMEYVEGKNLHEMLHERGEPFAEDQVLEWSVQICKVLNYLHTHDPPVIYRDLKPSNVIVATKGGGTHITLVDLGIAKSVVDNATSARLTVAGQMFGSPVYMSPEQCMGQEADYRSDLYALGCLMYDCLSGNPPFDHDSTYNVMWQHVNEPPSRLPFMSENSKVPEPLLSIMFKLLHKDPENRFQTAAEVKAELTALVQGTLS